MIIKINETDYWGIHIIGLGLCLVVCNKKAKYFGKSRGWHIDMCLRKNTIYSKAQLAFDEVSQLGDKK